MKFLGFFLHFVFKQDINSKVVAREIKLCCFFLLKQILHFTHVIIIDLSPYKSAEDLHSMCKNSSMYSL